MRLVLSALAAIPLLACATNKPIPIDQLADSRAAIRSAEELGAGEVPAAAHHLDLARQQTERAYALLEEGEEQRAAYLLERATADAELALALAREVSTHAEAQRVLERVQSLRSTMNPALEDRDEP